MRFFSKLINWIKILIISADSTPRETKTQISIDEWIDVWGTIVGNAKRMDDFPMWLQYYPKVLFDIINRSGTYQCSQNLTLLKVQWCAIEMQCLLHNNYVNEVALSQEYIP